jgi:hypothetical protein
MFFFIQFLPRKPSPMAQIKSSKPVIISTSALNSQGFRMLTEGAILDDYEENPLLLFNHIRPSGSDKNQILPLGNIVDLKVEGDKIIGYPSFDEDDAFAMSIYKKWENGTLRMASAGAEPIETSSDVKHLLPGQTKETVTKWKLKETSICDIGSNPEALAIALYDSNGKMIQLSDSIIKTLPDDLKTPDMSNKKKDAPPAEKPEVKLKKLTEEEEKKKQEELEAQLAEDDEDEKDKEIAKLKEEIASLKARLKLAEEGEEEPEAKAKKLADTALKMRKITLAERDHIVKLAVADYDSTLKMLQARKAAAPSVKETLELNDKASEGEQARIVELSKKSYDELFHSGDLEFLKLHAPDIFKAKFKTKFGKEPKNI